MMACCRLQLNAQWVQANCRHMRIKTDLMINAPSSVIRSDKILPKVYFDKNYEVHIPTRHEWNESRVDLNDEAVCCTDGLRLSGTGLAGAGVYNQTDHEGNWNVDAQYFKLKFTLYYNVQSSAAYTVETMRQLQYALAVRQL